MSGEEWGPWIGHDGKGCPVRGMMVQCVWLPLEDIEEYISEDGEVSFVVPDDAGSNIDDTSWIWRIVDGQPECYNSLIAPIIRYRIRRPRGLTLLRHLIEDLPAPVPVRECEDA